MNTEEVRAMTDAITDGKVFTHQWEEEDYEGPERNVLHFATGSTGFTFHASGFASSDPRIAEEIASALVAWASRKRSMATLAERLEWSATLSPKSERGEADDV